MRRILVLLLTLPILAGCGRKRCAAPGCRKEAKGTYCEEHAPRPDMEGTVEEIYTFAPGEETK